MFKKHNSGVLRSTKQPAIVSGPGFSTIYWRFLWSLWQYKSLSSCIWTWIFGDFWQFFWLVPFQRAYSSGDWELGRGLGPSGPQQEQGLQNRQQTVPGVGLQAGHPQVSLCIRSTRKIDPVAGWILSPLSLVKLPSFQISKVFLNRKIDFWMIRWPGQSSNQSH